MTVRTYARALLRRVLFRKSKWPLERIAPSREPRRFDFPFTGPMPRYESVSGKGGKKYISGKGGKKPSNSWETVQKPSNSWETVQKPSNSWKLFRFVPPFEMH